MKIMPIQFNNPQLVKKQQRQSFASNEPAVSNQSPPQVFYAPPVLSREFPRVKDRNLVDSLNLLNHLEFDKKDVERVHSMGVVLPFLSGKEAIDLIKKKKIEVKFDTLPSESIHAQYDFDENAIKINEIYKNTQSQAEIIAMSEAILHEAGHAKDYDSASSLQEEIDCLALNAVSHRVYKKKNPDLFSQSNSLIIKEGVSLYEDLFFDDDPLKIGLVKRLRQKYGDLPAGDLAHPPSNIALKVKES